MNQTQALERVKKGNPKNNFIVAEFHQLKCDVCGRVPRFCYEYWKGDIRMEVCPICYNKLNRLEKLLDSIPEVI